MVRADKTATVAPSAPSSAGTAAEHEQLQQYGVFKLSYDTANVSAGLEGRGTDGLLAAVDAGFRLLCCKG